MGAAGSTTARGRPFLTAQWRRLVMATYAVDPALLAGHVPRGLELDVLPGRAGGADGAAFVSVVAFEFLDTRVFGVRWPGHVNFPEVNLRYYVRGSGGKGDGRRGVCFIRELVPRVAASWLARRLYNEPYQAARMRSAFEERGEGVEITHEFRVGRSRRLERIEARASGRTWVPPDGSVEHFFKEHQWGFGTDRRGRAVVYEVRHPAWAVHRESSMRLDVDFGRVYGPAWGVLNGATPVSVMIAVGSAVEVWPAGLLEHR